MSSKRIEDDGPDVQGAVSTSGAGGASVTGWWHMLDFPPAAPAPPDDRFASLRREMDCAYSQASMGKGMERHGDDGRFEDQTTIRMARELGTAFPVGQAVKKLIEGERMMKAGNAAGALREWHGAMVYAAMACIVGRRA